MAKRTLLDMTQNILSAMDSDEVNSIGDTVESLQVAEVIKETYELITVNIDIPGRANLVKLDASGDPDRPNEMTVPANVEKVEWIKYNGCEVKYLDPLTYVNYTNIQGDDMAVDSRGLYYYTDRDPMYFTSFDDNLLVFNGVNLEEGATLMQSKTLCWGQYDLHFELSDDFIPALPVEMFPRLLSEAKSVCFINYKEVANSKEEQRSRQQKVSNQNNRYRAGRKKPIDRLPDYGRKR